MKATVAPVNFHFHDLQPPQEDFLAAAMAGLRGRPRRLSPKYFYDAAGSALFDAITEQPEYYLTRTEIGLLRRHAGEIASLLGPGTALLEFGSGSDVKVRLLLEALRPRAYLPLDISAGHLRRAGQAIALDHPWLDVHAICTDYTRRFPLPAVTNGCRRTAFFPGSSIGNFEPAQAAGLLRAIGSLLGTGGRLLIGVDLKKGTEELHAAYNDAGGVTAAFNLNLLHRMRRELNARLDPAAFRHHAFYNTAAGRIEMHLIASRAHEVVLGSERFAFAEGDGIHTENAYKFSLPEFAALAASAGFRTCHVWQDEAGRFSVHCLEAT